MAPVQRRLQAQAPRGPLGGCRGGGGTPGQAPLPRPRSGRRRPGPRVRRRRRPWGLQCRRELLPRESGPCRERCGHGGHAGGDRLRGPAEVHLPAGPAALAHCGSRVCSAAAAIHGAAGKRPEEIRSAGCRPAAAGPPPPAREEARDGQKRGGVAGPLPIPAVAEGKAPAPALPREGGHGPSGRGRGVTVAGSTHVRAACSGPGAV
mmetsp:Transcript_111816/g.349757  ORF Transcript_111816/g.349757 Transcript_111816/m.349757 type:complete len:206 (+) Transcript_111816:52-669(+)